MVDKVTLEQIFFKYFGFPCQSSFHQLLHGHHNLVIWGWYNMPESDSNTKWAQSHPMRKKLMGTLPSCMKGQEHQADR
jgi:hypothetical protein